MPDEYAISEADCAALEKLRRRAEIDDSLVEELRADPRGVLISYGVSEECVSVLGDGPEVSGFSIGHPYPDPITPIIKAPKPQMPLDPRPWDPRYGYEPPDWQGPWPPWNSTGYTYYF